MIIGVLVLVIFVIAALFQLINPRKALMFGRKWQFKGNIEPSDISILIARITALFVIVLIIYITFISLKPLGVLMNNSYNFH